jgi:hypothetical protein
MPCRSFSATPPRVFVRCLFGIVCGALLSGGVARGDDWMFRPSYFTHAPAASQPRYITPPMYRSAYRPAVTGLTPGFAVRGGYRWNHITLGTGRFADVTILRGGFFEQQP